MSTQTSLSKKQNINDKIYTIRGEQVMLDRDLAELYQVETRALKQAVKRNQKRFPHDFMFILDESEIDVLVSQSVIPSRQILGGAKPYAFTEQGVASISGVLSSDKAVDVHVQIMRAFVYMRKFIKDNALLFQRIDCLEKQQLITATKLEQIFQAIEDKNIKPQTGIFFEGQIFDAYVFVSKLIKQAKQSVILIDNYVDESVLTLLSKRSKNCTAIIYTKDISKRLQLDIKKYNEQYAPIEVQEFDNSHDRFLILDEMEVYHIGASLKDLGKKWFAFSKLEKNSILEIFKRLI
ncbi:MAG: ORF6N domain-containing protein [Gammaproteobacteria bacterium]|nr:ORF6N domain-containing protein [Gammaproteobacteria bacterium]